MPASRPRKAKPVEMRRTERLWTAFDQSQAINATATPTTAICQSNPRKCSSCNERRIRCRGGRLGVDVVTAQDSSWKGGLGFSKRQSWRFKRWHFKCCIESGNMQHLLHGRAAVEILALERALQRLALAADAAAGSRPF